MAEEKNEAVEEKKVEEKKSSGSGMDPKLAGLLCWLLTPITSVLFMFMDDTKKDDFIQFHAKQSLYFFFAEIACWVIVGILSVVTMGILSCVGLLLPLVFLGVRVYGGYQAYQGERFKLPVIGDMAEK